MTLGRAAILGLLFAALIAVWHFAQQEVESVKPSGDEISGEALVDSDATTPPQEPVGAEGAPSAGKLPNGTRFELATGFGAGTQGEFFPAGDGEGSGRVRVRVLGPEKRPLAGAEVRGEAGKKVQTEATDSDGWATMRTAPDGVLLHLTARASGYAPGSMVIVGGGDVILHLGEEVVLEGRVVEHTPEEVEISRLAGASLYRGAPCPARPSRRA